MKFETNLLKRINDKSTKTIRCDAHLDCVDANIRDDAPTDKYANHFHRQGDEDAHFLTPKSVRAVSDVTSHSFAERNYHKCRQIFHVAKFSNDKSLRMDSDKFDCAMYKLDSPRNDDALRCMPFQRHCVQAHDKLHEYCSLLRAERECLENVHASNATDECVRTCVHCFRTLVMTPAMILASLRYSDKSVDCIRDYKLHEFL